MTLVELFKDSQRSDTAIILHKDFVNSIHFIDFHIDGVILQVSDLLVASVHVRHLHARDTEARAENLLTWLRNTSGTRKRVREPDVGARRFVLVGDFNTQLTTDHQHITGNHTLGNPWRNVVVEEDIRLGENKKKRKGRRTQRE